MTGAVVNIHWKAEIATRLGGVGCVVEVQAMGKTQQETWWCDTVTE